MSGEVSFLNLFRDSRKPLDSIRDKHCSMSECWDDMVQCESCEEWLRMSCEGFKTASEGEWLCIVCRSPDSRRLRIVKVLFWIPQQLIIVKIRKLD